MYLRRLCAPRPQRTQVRTAGKAGGSRDSARLDGRTSVQRRPVAGVHAAAAAQLLVAGQAEIPAVVAPGGGLAAIGETSALREMRQRCGGRVVAAVTEPLDLAAVACGPDRRLQHDLSRRAATIVRHAEDEP